MSGPRRLPGDPPARSEVNGLREWLGAGPVGVVLVPGNDTAVPGRLAEKLIVPEAH